jgi:tetratricopeptide (TPR) repeat protein
MHSYLLFCLIFCLVITPCHADEGHGFPGKGERSQWLQANTHFNEGVKLYRAANYDAAVAKYKEAIEVYPDDYEFYNSLGLAYKKKNQLDEALTALKKSIELKDNSWESWSNLGSIYKHQNHHKEAFDAYSKALQYNPPQASKTLLLQNVEAEKQKMNSSSPAK